MLSKTAEYALRAVACMGSQVDHPLSANVLAERAHKLGWTVSFLHAPDGKDWNDVLLEKAE